MPMDAGCPPPPIYCGADEVVCYNPPPPDCPECMGHDFCAPSDHGCPPPPLHCGEDQMPCMNPPPPECPDCPMSEFCAPMDQGCPPPPPVALLNQKKTTPKGFLQQPSGDRQEARADWLEAHGGADGAMEAMEDSMS